MPEQFHSDDAGVGRPTGGPTATTLEEAIRANGSVTAIDLTKKGIGNNGAKQLAASLANNKSVTTLNLQGCHLGVDGARAIRDALLINRSVTSVDFTDNGIGKDGVSAMMQVIATNKSIKSLCFQACNIGTEGAVLLSEGIMAKDCPLESIDLSQNGIMQEGAKHMKKALLANKEIKCNPKQLRTAKVDGVL